MIARLLLVLALAGASPAFAQVALDTDPKTPVRGTLFRLRVTPTVPEPVERVSGSVAGEPLHFQTGDHAIWEGYAPVPINGDDSLEITLVLESAGRPDTVYTRIAVAQGSYRHEQLKVPPSMAQPDSAAQVRIAEEIQRARMVSRGAHETPRQWTGPFMRPRPGRITSPFGTAREYNGQVTSRHLGTDFAGKVGAPVVATNDARVALVADFYLAGSVVYLDHGEGLISAYFHLSRTLVQTGDLVKRGQRIGEVGQSGRVTGPHLHWVMRYGGTTVDPMSVLSLLGEPAAP